MKRIFLVIIYISIISVINSYAQIGFELGYILSDFRKEEKTVKPMNGFYAGISYNMKFNKIVSIAPEVRYSFGSRSDGIYDFLVAKAEESTQVHLLEIPINLRFKIPLGKKSGLAVYGGPTLSYAVSGERSYEFVRSSQNDPLLTYRYDYFKGKSYSKNIPPNILEVIDNNTDKDIYTRFDVLLGAGAGFFFRNMFIIHAGYDLGMFNRYADTSKGKIERNILHAGITFLF